MFRPIALGGLLAGQSAIPLGLGGTQCLPKLFHFQPGGNGGIVRGFGQLAGVAASLSSWASGATGFDQRSLRLASVPDARLRPSTR